MTISNKILDELLSGVDRPDDLPGDTGLIKELKVRLMERMLGLRGQNIWAMSRTRKRPANKSTDAMAPAAKR